VGKGVLTADGVNESRWELYDIEADRSELNNLASAEPEKVKELSKKFLEYANRANVLPFGGKKKKPKKKKK